MPTPMRAEFIITNIAFKPLLASPTSQPVAPSKSITQVALPWMPIFSSMREQASALRAPSVPSAAGMNLGTMNSEIPLVPCGASGKRASTRWQILAAMSCSPDEMKILVPEILKLPSACGAAFERSMPRSVPQCGSVRHIVPVHSPDTSRGRYSAFWAGVPCAVRQS